MSEMAGPFSERALPLALVLGSGSDWGVVQPVRHLLDRWEINTEIKVLSAHRTPVEVAQWASSLKTRGFQVVIAAAGMSAALPGVVAAHCPLPVIALPIASEKRHDTLNGLDALTASAQMPPGVPVMTVGINQALNAILAALRILALNDPRIAELLDEYQDEQRRKVVAADTALRTELGRTHPCV